MFAFLQEGLFPYLSGWLHLTSDGAVYTLYFALFFLVIIISYLLGSINSAILISRLFYHADIRTAGSKNAGATNMQRVFGWRAGLFTLLFDMLKTFLAIAVAFVLLGGNWIVPEGGQPHPFGSTFSCSPSAYAAALFCVLGHIFPLYYRFHGGKGVLCAGVAIGMLSPWLLLVELIVFFGTVAMTKYVSLGSVVAAAAYPIFYASMFKLAFSGDAAPWANVLIVFLIAGILVWAHRGNIQRLRNGEEPRFSLHRRTDEDAAHPNDEEDYDL